MATNINRCFMRFEDRAERITAEQVARTFVSVGPLLDLLSSNNHQVIYGKRGTGKTHALRYFQSIREKSGDLSVYIDAQNLGSNGSIYNDTGLPIGERATRLLVDVCSALHHALLQLVTDPKRDWDLSKAAPILDDFVGSFTETRVVGSTEVEERFNKVQTGSDAVGVIGGFSGGPAATIGISAHQSREDSESFGAKSSGNEESWVDFNYFARQVRRVADFIGPKRLWILIDEWATIPREIQPYLADLLRRAFFNVPNITLKVAAIEHRALFKMDRSNGGYIGFELGADISAAINLDDYLVVENNEDRARVFFQNFIFNHASAVSQELQVEISRSERFTSEAFTQDNVFLEFIRASEGVPRDAMHILSSAAQKSNDNAISMPDVRSAAYGFFMREKYTSIQANAHNRIMLDWIRDEVISGRQTRAFLLPIGDDDEIIDRLFDSRALHILNRSRSAAHRPGERFIVYKLDYGLYVDLINTEKFPQGLLFEGDQTDSIEFDVPADDARSYRRAILDLSAFYDRHPDI